MSQVMLRGRERELATVLATMGEAARTSSGALLVISGEPGIGKSALLRVAAGQATRLGFVVGLGKAEEIDQIAPGAPLLVALRSGPRPLIDGTAFATLAPLYERQLWLVERIGVILAAAAAQTPLVVAIDDVQWADGLTRFALRVLPGRLAGSPIVWVLTSRLASSAVADELVAAAEDSVRVQRVPLDRLAPGNIDEMARDRLGKSPSAAVRDLLRGVGGNPFWALQVLDGLAWRAARGLAIEGMHAELMDDVRRRLLSLGPETVALVRLAAVWGRALEIAAAGHLLGDPPAADLIRATREAEDNGLLNSGADGVFFSHDLVREAVYADLAGPQRDALHRDCARYLLADAPTALAAASHFRAIAAADDDEAVLALERAAADSVTMLPDQAAELAQEAFALLSPEHPRWLVTGQHAVALLVRVQREGAVVAIADRLLAGTQDGELRAQLQVQACRALWATGACPEIERRVDRTLAERLSRTARAQLIAVRALASTRTTSAGSAAAAAELALDEGRRLGDELTQQMALHALAEAARNAGRHQTALDRYTDLRVFSRLTYLAEEIRALQHLDRYDEADTMLAKVRHAVQDDVDKVLPSFLYAQIWQDHNLARLDAAEAGAQTLLRSAWEIGNFTYQLNARMVLAGVAIYRGDVSRARILLRPAELSDESEDELRVSRLRLTQGWLAAEEGDLETSLRILRPLVAAAANGGHAWSWSPPWMRVFAGIGLLAGDREFAEAAARIAELGAERNPGVKTMVGVARQVRGMLDNDVAALAEAVVLLRQAPRPLLLARALADHGAALRSAGQPAAATECLAEASRRFEALGAVPAALSGTGGQALIIDRRRRPGRGPRRPGQGLGSLTEAERVVAELIGAGHSSRSAAAELVVSPNTVNSHLRSVFGKLGIRSRVQLANLLRDQRSDGDS